MEGVGSSRLRSEDEDIGTIATMGTSKDLPDPSSDSKINDVEGSVEEVVSGIRAWEAYMSLVRGNLGPGTLNLPYAFARVGWIRGLIILLAVSIQGAYSMLILLKCKRALQSPHSSPETFMDVSFATFGRYGKFAVEICISILQLGVCCVFLELVSTNLQAGLSGLGYGINPTICTLLITIVLIMLSMFRKIRQLTWLTTGANVMMFIALFSATTEALIVIHQGHGNTSGSGSATDVFFFLSSMFYAYEGIAIVLPVENSFCRNKHLSPTRTRDFQNVLIGAICTLSSFMLIVGASCGTAFSDITSGSITAYLATERTNPWFKVVNALTLLAVLLTFPLQLYPAIEVINEWFGPGCRPRCCQNRARVSNGGHRPVPASELDESALYSSAPTRLYVPGQAQPYTYRCRFEWIIRRALTVLVCAGVTTSINNLALLVALFGSVGSPGLVLMPSVIHLRLQYTGKVPVAIPAVVMDVMVILFSLMVGIAGAYFAISQLTEDPQVPKV